MEKAIRDFPKQFEWRPKVENTSRLRSFSHVVVGGIGGSHLTADVLNAIGAPVPLSVHRDYGLPAFAKPDALYIASSYSGNTEETLDFAYTAHKRGLNLAVVTTGGKLLEFARANSLPYITLPSTGIQPRSALGFSLIALARLIGAGKLLSEVMALSGSFDMNALETRGRELAKKLAGRVPVMYASERNSAVAYNWKIKMNETGKIPAFMNVFPELNHNEMTGFDATPKSKPLSEKFAFVFLADSEDDSRITKRFATTRELYEARGLPVFEMPLSGSSRVARIFDSLLIADWTAYHIAKANGAEPEQVPMVEEFKQRIK